MIDACRIFGCFSAPTVAEKPLADTLLRGLRPGQQEPWTFRASWSRSISLAIDNSHTESTNETLSPFNWTDKSHLRFMEEGTIQLRNGRGLRRVTQLDT